MGRNEQAAKKRRTVFADVALCQIDQQHLAFVHNAADVRVLFRRSQYPIEQGISQESADFVLNWRRTIGAVAEGEPFKFLQQKVRTVSLWSDLAICLRNSLSEKVRMKRSATPSCPFRSRTDDAANAASND